MRFYNRFIWNWNEYWNTSNPFILPNYYDKIYFPVGSNENNCYLENYFEESTLLFSCVADYEIKFENKKLNDYTKY